MADINDMNTNEMNELELTADEQNMEESPEVVEVEEVVQPVKKGRVRSQKYVSARSMVDRTISYPVEQGVELLKTTSYSKFPGTITLHVNLRKEIKPLETSLPFSTGKEIRVAIANDALLADLAQEKIEFDILITTPDMMPKLAKFARLLGPRGLMPNPKNGTVTTDPQSKAESFKGGTVSIKPEKKAPLLHIRVGKTNQATEELVANIQAVIAALPLGSAMKAVIAPTMGPGVKIQL